MRKKSFTVLEMVLALVVFGIVFSAVMTIYTRMINVKREFDARNYLLTTTYTMVEKLNILLKDYTIDYEEYFNRRMAGCTTPGLFTGWSVGTTGNCTVFDGYGNQNPTDALQAMGAVVFDTGLHILYRCSSNTDYFDDNIYSYVINQGTDVLTGNGCALPNEVQSFGEYRQQFINVKDNADETASPIGDDDDTDIGKGPIAIPDNEHVQELYLISKDKKSRLFLRRKLVGQNDANNNSTYEPFERLYVIQMLQLRGFDAGTKHSFNAADAANLYMYDGQIDTWACDYDKGFICNGTGVSSIYSGYRLPANADDGWVNLFGGDVTIAGWNLRIYPSKDPVYTWAENSMQINPYIRVFVQTYLYAPSWYTKIDMKTFNKIFYDLQTLFNIKTYY